MSKQFTSLGMMSGTSGDGVDTSIIISDGYSNYNVLKEKYFKYDQDIFEEIHKLKKNINTKEDLKKFSNDINRLERKITLFHGKVAKELLFETSVDIIGFHGQTIYHDPKNNISVQIGDGKLLSQITQKNVVFDFRKNDIKNGGEGAPLAPIYHKLIVQKKKINLPICILNIGGISNITLIKDFQDENLISQDLGPGNCLIDNWIRNNSEKKIDFEGRVASRGKINEIILEQALELYENFAEQNLSSSFDIKDFDISFARGLSLEDGASTLTEYSARIISTSLNDIFDKHNLTKTNVILCGGGRKNNYLVDRIKLNSKNNISFLNIDTFGIDGDFVESQAFAYLAIRSVNSFNISFPKTTGCVKPCTGGTLVQY